MFADHLVSAAGRNPKDEEKKLPVVFYGAPSRARVQLRYFCGEKTMVYGRYNELVHGGFVMAYKPTDNWGAPSRGVFEIYREVFGCKKLQEVLGVWGR